MAGSDPPVEALANITSKSASAKRQQAGAEKLDPNEDPESELNVLRREVRRLQAAERDAQLQIAAQQDELIELRAENDAFAARESELIGRLASERASVRRTMAVAESLVANLRALELPKDDVLFAQELSFSPDRQLRVAPAEVKHSVSESSRGERARTSKDDVHVDSGQQMEHIDPSSRSPFRSQTYSRNDSMVDSDPTSCLEMSTVDEPEYVQNLRLERLSHTVRQERTPEDDKLTEREILPGVFHSSLQDRAAPMDRTESLQLATRNRSDRDSDEESDQVETESADRNDEVVAEHSESMRTLNQMHSARSPIVSLNERNLHDMLIDEKRRPEAAVNISNESCNNVHRQQGLSLLHGEPKRRDPPMEPVRRADSVPLLRHRKTEGQFVKESSSTSMPSRPLPVLVTASQSASPVRTRHSPPKTALNIACSEFSAISPSLAAAADIAHGYDAAAREGISKPVHGNLNDPFPASFSFSTADAHEGDIYALSCLPGSSIIASGGDDRVLRLYDCQSRKICGMLTECNRAVTTIDFEAEGHLLACGSHDGFLRFWRKGKRRREKWALDVVLPGHNGAVRKVFFDRRSPTAAPRLFSAAADRTIKLTDITFGKRPFVASSSSAVFDMDFQEQSTVLLTGHRDGGIRMWSPRDGNRTIADAAKVHNRAVTSVCCLENGYGVITFGRDGVLKHLDIRSLGEVVRELDGSIQTVSDWHKASLLGRHVACGINMSGGVGIWNVDSGKLVRKLCMPPPTTGGDVLELFQPPAGFVVVPLWTAGGLATAHKSKRISFWT